MMIILGMAKSSICLNGAINQKIELDLLRLIYTITNVEKEKIQIKSYFLVFNQAIQNRLEHWIKKYKFDNSKNKIEIILFENDVKNNEEFKKNVLENKFKKNANAKIRADISENLLHEKISKLNNISRKSTNEKKIFYGVEWDAYYEKY